MGCINKILLVNDMRGAQEYLHRAYLKMGLNSDIAIFGYPLASTITRSMNFDPLRTFGLFGKIPRPIINLLNVKKLQNYDVASYVHRISFVDKPHFLRYKDLPIVREKVRVMSYTGLGCDEISYVADNEKLPYRPCATCQQFDDPTHRCEKIVRPLKTKAVENLNKYFDCVFSAMAEYDHIKNAYVGTVERMPLPLDVSEIPWIPSGQNKLQKIKIIHTPSRQGFKGTAVVLAAIDNLSEIRSDFEFKILTGLPFGEYIQAVGEADIVIDQVWSQSPGMNALWLLGMGKIVFSGNTNLAKSYFPFAVDSPIINADPNPQSLAHDLSRAISSRGGFSRLSEMGREYVRSNHDHLKIAEQYLSYWEGKYFSSGSA
jgi:hypothetical protein